ncbi:MAG: tyrosine--tRNA ligase [Bacteroidetes bacterium]|nr:tyrosine--tRNA ligase [Bacteroidota bacterium]
MTFIEELKLRGLLQDMIPGTEEFIENNEVKGYIGYDPTAPSLTIGNLVTIMMLVHLQRHGKTPVVLFGGATGRVGDPSGKDAERKLLPEDVIEANLANQVGQFKRLLNFEDGHNKAITVNNYDWFKNIGFIEFLRDAGKHLTINYMMSKESVKRRIETGLSFTEFSYQLLQGYDFYHLYENHGVNLQLGGSDQWGNITTGTELVRRKSGGEVYAAVCPLLTKADGSKFGKSEGGNVWLDPKMTSPYKFYQFFMNAADADVEKMLKIFSLRPIEEILEIIEQHNADPGRRYGQKILAEDATILVHGEEELQKAQDATSLLFGKGTAETLMKLDEETLLSIFDGVPTFHISKTELSAGINIIELLATNTSILSSKGEARREIKGNAISINKTKVTKEDHQVTNADLLNNKYMLVQKGKKNYNLLIAE